jgi:hypothetical protein
MAITLYDLTVATYRQTLRGLAGVMEKGLKHCTANGIDPQTLFEAKLAPDMLPLPFQIASVVHHSVHSIDAARTGISGPPGKIEATDYAGLQKMVADAVAALDALTPDDVNALEGGDVTFVMGSFKIPFTTAGYMLSFSLPNFFFHATTAYDILRNNGVKLGKQDFLGPLRMKG